MKKNLKIYLAVLILLFTFGKSFAQSVNEEVIIEINKIRTTGCYCDGKYMPPVTPVHWNKQLEISATKHANDLYSNKYLDHIGTDNSTPKQRMIKTGYDAGYAGEIIAHGQTTANEVVNGWKNSPSHCVIMMFDKFTDIGTNNKEKYWVVNFGSQN